MAARRSSCFSFSNLGTGSPSSLSVLKGKTICIYVSPFFFYFERKKKKRKYFGPLAHRPNKLTVIAKCLNQKQSVIDKEAFTVIVHPNFLVPYGLISPLALKAAL